MPRKLLPPVAYVIKKNREKVFFGHGGIQECADALGVHRQMLTRWESGETNPSRANMKKLADVFFLTLKEFMDEVRQAPGNSLPPPNVEDRREIMRTDGMVVVGVAAADVSEGSRAGIMHEDVGEQFEEIISPRMIRLMRVKGDSLSPVALDGQYIMVGDEIGNGPVRDGDIVVARVQVEVGIAERSREHMDARWEGVYCKRVYDGGDAWLFKSISKWGSSPFSVFKGYCRLWPMLGTLFAGRGRIPEED